jgi:hypothetical protein
VNSHASVEVGRKRPAYLQVERFLAKLSDLRFNDGVPTDLVVQMGAEVGAGETTVDLTSDYAQDFDASIEGGVGEATVLVPSVGTAVRVSRRRRAGQAFPHLNDAGEVQRLILMVRALSVAAPAALALVVGIPALALLRRGPLKS